MMLQDCKNQGHKVRVENLDNGYHEYCDTCGAHACLCKPK